jgi:hypothetical protein
MYFVIVKINSRKIHKYSVGYICSNMNTTVKKQRLGKVHARLDSKGWWILSRL